MHVALCWSSLLLATVCLFPEKCTAISTSISHSESRDERALLFDPKSIENFKSPEWLHLQRLDTTFNNSCSKDLQSFFSALSSSQPKTWALSMLDSFGKMSAGILNGCTIWVGSYDQCRSIEQKTNSTAGPPFTTKFCWAYLKLHPEIKAWFMPKLEPAVYFQSGVCVPNTCNEEQIVQFVRVISDLPYLGELVNTYVNVTRVVCVEDHSIWENVTDSCLAIFFIILVALVLVATLYDLQCNNSSKKNNKEDEIPSNSRLSFFLAFSMHSNGKKLLSSKGSNHCLPVVNGLRVVSLVWIFFGHAVVAYLLEVGRVVSFVEAKRSVFVTMYRQAAFGFETLFFLSGLLLTHEYLKERQHSADKISWLRFYAGRYFRMTPAYLLILGSLFAVIFKYVGDGPFSSALAEHASSCQKYWWTNALYFNNFTPDDMQCMRHTWFFAVDMQLFILSPLLLYPFTKSVRRSIFIAVLAVALSCCASGFFGIHYELPLDIDFVNAHPGPRKYKEVFRLLHSKPYTHLGTYVIGMVSGWYIHKRSKVKMNKIMVAIGWLMTFVTMGTLIFIVRFSASDYLIVRILYFAFSRISWSAAMAWIVIACWSGYGGIINRVLSIPIWNPLSRLSYCAYLWHPAVMMWIWNTTDLTLDFVVAPLIILTIALLIIVFVGAIVLSLLFESPFVALQSNFSRRPTTLVKVN